MTQPIQVGVIGTGSMGGRHARNLAQHTVGSQVAALMDADQSRAREIAEYCGGARIYSDASALIADPDVDAVVIASPDSTHAEFAIACIDAGKPTLCEKPLATSLEEVEKVLHAEVATGRRLVQVGFMREYDPAHLQSKDLLDQGDLGQPLYFRNVHNHAGADIRNTNDVIVSSAVHDFHSARWLMNSEIESVYVQWVVSDTARPESCRYLSIQLTFANGALGTLEIGTETRYGYEVYVELTCRAGMMRSQSISSPTILHDGIQIQTVDQEWLARFDTAYQDEAQAWVQAIINQQATGPSVWDGYMSLLVADACVRSAASGQPEKCQTVERPALYG